MVWNKVVGFDQGFHGCRYRHATADPWPPDRLLLKVDAIYIGNLQFTTGDGFRLAIFTTLLS